VENGCKQWVCWVMLHTCRTHLCGFGCLLHCVATQLFCQPSQQAVGCAMSEGLEVCDVSPRAQEVASLHHDRAKSHMVV
jgi:hypothetical protein